MSTHCYIGATRPDNPHLVHARFVLFDGHPAVVVPTLATIWAGHAHHDTIALITAILAHDWEYLDPDTIATTLSPFAGQRPVPGVGMTLASEVDPPEPVTVFPLCHAGHLDAEWIYLIGPDTDTIAVHTSDGTRLATYPLVNCLHPAGTDRAERPCRSRAAAGALR
ncbi:hypothetical protein ONA91_29565 [Micromonospora sp. DR5-3]|uniref:hypothetical protein n=1 Tax=unclassified Micromonospora TaxID=2617518 RepID=UPI0011D6E667|nr:MULTISPECIES: hypothetical protein [unclassified Micromonospora]MCW3818595.1 hypothetical protein [Micromonospora sp. DR5-3]TYC20053.1 hypothetical protein FXF52_33335 [Micromonospora sp. MP36]